jgi:hypothetical protein
MQKGVQLKIRKVGSPDQSGKIIQHAIVDRPAFRLCDLRRFHPTGSMRWAFLLVKILAVHAIRVPLQGDGAAL